MIKGKLKVNDHVFSANGLFGRIVGITEKGYAVRLQSTLFMEEITVPFDGLGERVAVGLNAHLTKRDWFPCDDAQAKAFESAMEALGKLK